MSGHRIVIVIPLPVSVTPFAKLCATLEGIHPEAALRSVQPGDDIDPIELRPGDMICDMRNDS